MTPISVTGLTRRFGTFTAVDHVSFRVERGTIFGLLGANGAGKSTTIRMLCGLLRSSSGHAEVAGYDIDRHPDRVRGSIGYMSQQFSLYRDLTVAENISFFGGVYGLSAHTMRERERWVIEMAGLKGRERTRAENLSGGWLQRLALGCAVLHRPTVLFLDEPTGGCGSRVPAATFGRSSTTLPRRETTVVVTTHYLDEAEFCNDVCLMHAGRIVAQGPPSRLKRDRLPYRLWQVECADAARFQPIMQDQPWVTFVSIFGRALHVGTTLPETEARRLIHAVLGSSGDGIDEVTATPIEPSLEDVFIHVIEAEQAAGVER